MRLSRLTDPALVMPTAAQTLGLKDAGGQPIAETLRAYLRERQLLLVLDNFEQVVGAAPEVSALLATSRDLKVIVTSRVVLRLQGEHEYPVPPLALPAEHHAESPAVTLFVQQAQASRPDFRLTEATAPAVAAICTRLDGLPLAIVLAAARVKVLPPVQLLARLEPSLPVLTGGARDAEERHQTMQAAITWSYDLLRPEEQRLFRRLAVFVEGCTLEAAEAVCAAPNGAAPLGLDMLEGLGTLLDQSLVWQREDEEGKEGKARFGMLQVIREYASERLEASGEAETVRRAHADYFLSLTEQAGPALLQRVVQPAWLQRLEQEHDNLRAALGWSLGHGAAEIAARLCVSVGPFWAVRGYENEGRRQTARALRLSEVLSPRQRALLLLWAGRTAEWQGDYAAAATQLGESLALFRSLEDKAGSGLVLTELAVCAAVQEQLGQAQRLLDEGLILLQEVGDRLGVLWVLKRQAELADSRGDLPAARSIWQRAFALAQSLGDTHLMAMCKMELGWHALLRGNGAAAQALLDEALAVQRQMRDKGCSAVSLAYLGMVALEQGGATAAHGLFEQCVALFEEVASLQPRIAGVLVWLGAARFAMGDVQGADDAYLKSLRIERGLASRRRTAACLDSFAEVALARGQPERTARLLGAAAQALGALAPAPLPPRLAAQRERVAVDAQQALGDEAWAAAFAAGRALSLEEAVAEALGEDS